MEKNSYVKTLSDAIRTGVWATRDAFHIFPGLAFGAWSSCLIMMMVPSLQVWSVRWASHAFTPGTRSVPVAVCAVVALCATLLGAASSVYGSVSQMLQMSLRTRYGADFSAAMQDLSPAQTLDNELMSRVRATREAIPFNVAWQATSTITVTSAIVSMLMLAGSLWTISPWVALLVALALFPDLLTRSRLAGVENDVWIRQGAVGRRIDYLEQLQDFTPSSTELAAHPGSFGITKELRRIQDKYASLWNEVPRAALRLAGLANICVFALIFSAVAVIAWNGAGVVDVAAAMLGILSGLSVTRSVGSAFGNFWPPRL